MVDEFTLHEYVFSYYNGADVGSWLALRKFAMLAANDAVSGTIHNTGNLLHTLRSFDFISSFPQNPGTRDIQLLQELATVTQRTQSEGLTSTLVINAHRLVVWGTQVILAAKEAGHNTPWCTPSNASRLALNYGTVVNHANSFASFREQSTSDTVQPLGSSIVTALSDARQKGMEFPPTALFIDVLKDNFPKRSENIYDTIRTMLQSPEEVMREHLSKFGKKPPGMGGPTG